MNPFRIVRALVAVIALAVPVAAVVPASAQSFNFGFQTQDGFGFSFGNGNGYQSPGYGYEQPRPRPVQPRPRPPAPGFHHCMTDRAVIDFVRNSGYIDVRPFDGRGRYVRVTGRKFSTSYVISVDPCRARIVERAEIRNRNYGDWSNR